MRKYIITAALALLSLALSAQESKQEYMEKYNRLAQRLGSAGFGIEGHLNSWEAAYPDDPQMLRARFLYYFAKSQSSRVTVHNQAKFMGKAPALTLKDSLGRDVNYFEETMYDDELYGLATRYLGRAIELEPERIDFRFDKINSLVAYEKESPDMASAALMSLIDYNRINKPNWKYGEETFDEEAFKQAVQQYCYSFFLIGSPSAMESFFRISEKMNGIYPKEVLFIDNMGSYYLAYKNDLKKAEKYFKKALKISEDDPTALQNLVLLYRKKGDRKKESKYRSLFEQSKVK